MSTRSRAALLVAAIIVVILIVCRVWTAAPVATTSALEEPVGFDSPPAGNVPSYFSDGLADKGLDALLIADICADVEQASTSGDSELSDEEMSARMAAYKDAKRQATERLAVSQDAEHLHIAALLESNPANRIELITNAMKSSRNDAFLVWDAVRICTRVLKQTTCPLQEWEDRLLTIDGQNSEAWIRIAANRLHRGDDDGSLRAMQQAATSPVSRMYWTERIEAAERSLAAAGGFSFPERASYGVGISAQSLPKFGDYTKMCREKGAKNQEWAYACLAYGERLESQGKTLIGQSIAYALQEIALESLGDDERLATVAAREENARQDRNDLFLVARRNQAAIIGWSNPTIFYGFLATIRSDGEMAAQVYLQDETDRWLRERPELGCTPETGESEH